MLTAIPVITLIGETLLWGNFPARSGKMPVSFIKHKYLSIAVVVMKEKINHCALFQVSCWNYSGFTVGKYFFCPDSPIPMFTKACFSAFQSCVKTLLECTEPFHEQRGQGRVFYVLTAVMLLNQIGETVLSDDTQQEVDSSLIFKKLNNLTKVISVMKRKMNQCVILASLNLKLTSFHSGKYFFVIRPQFPGSQKKCFLRFSELCKDIARKQCTIPWEKKVRGECSVSVDCHIYSYHD